MTSSIVGIDLGTTTTLISRYSTRTKDAEVVEVAGHLLTPSVVAYGRNDLILGPNERKAPKIGHIAENAGGNVVIISDTKRIIGRRLYDKEVTKVREVFSHSLVADEAGSAVIQIPIGDKNGTFVNIYPQLVASDILKYVAMAYRQKFPEVTTLKAVVTIPAVFSETQRAATYEAAEIAGIGIMQLVSEPTAAAVQYLSSNEELAVPSKNGRFIVFDLGGGTLDVSIVNSSDDGKSILVEAVDGDPLLGGRDFDNIMLSVLTPRLVLYGVELQKTLVLSDKEAIRRESAIRVLKIECRRMKEALSSNHEIELNIALFSHLYPNIEEKEIFVTKAEFEKEVYRTDIVDRIMKPVQGAIEKSKLKKEDFTAVLLAGGGSRMPLIQTCVQKFFGKIPVLKARNVDHVVSQGAAIMAHNIGIKEITVTETLNHSFGIDVVGNKMGWLVRSGTVIPCSGKKMFTNIVDNQKSALITLKQGENEISSENMSMYNTSIPLTPCPAGKAKIEVTFSMDISQILHITARDTSFSKAKEFSVNLPGRMDKNTISRLSEGIISSGKSLTPVELQLQDLTQYFYNIWQQVMQIENPIDRKQHGPVLSTVESFILGARGDKISVSDIQSMKTKLNTIEAWLSLSSSQAASPLSPSESKKSFPQVNRFRSNSTPLSPSLVNGLQNIIFHSPDPQRKPAPSKK